MGWNAFSLRIGTLIGGVVLVTFQAVGGPPAGGRGVAPAAHVSAVPRGGGYVNWHAASNTGIFPASWNVGQEPWSAGPARGVVPAWNNSWGYHHGNGYGYGYGGPHNDVRRGVIVPIYPIFPFFDNGSYGYSDDSGAAPPPTDAGPDYGLSESAAPYPPYAPQPYAQPYQPSAPPYAAVPMQPASPPSEYHEPAAPAQPEPVVVQPPITIVLQNGQKFVVQNYAVMDATLWDFSKPVARKIPLSTIDVSASARATSAAGAEFPELTPSR